MNYYRLVNHDNGKYFDTISAKHIGNSFSYKRIELHVVAKQKHHNNVWTIRVSER